MNLLSLIIFIAIIVKIAKKSEETKEKMLRRGQYANGRSDASYTKNNAQGKAVKRQSVNPNYASTTYANARSTSPYTSASQQYSGTSQQRPVSQGELKFRLQQKYGQQSATQKDILSRAKNNADEEREDVVAHVMNHESHATECETPDLVLDSVADSGVSQSDILDTVNDLIVKGYSGEMTFERDFIAEGVEMLNRFSL